MNRSGSLLWILFLLAALFLGPAVILNRPKLSQQPLPKSRPALRTIVEQEHLLDAPAPLPDPASAGDSEYTYGR